MAEEGEAPEEEPTTEPEGENPSEPISKNKAGSAMIAEAVEVAEKLEKQNKIMSNNIRRLEELKATDMLGGRSEAGTEVKQKTEEEKLDEEAAKIVKMFD